MKKALIAPPLVAGLVLAAVVLWNHSALRQPLNDVLEKDPRNNGVSATAHFGNYVSTDELVFDLTAVSGDKAPADVFRVFLQYAEALKERSFDSVVLAYQGVPKFQMKGDYFQQLGREYATQNPVYTMRTFPENLFRADGAQAFGQWSGGWLGVVGKQMEDFTEFHKQWYINDLASGSS